MWDKHGKSGPRAVAPGVGAGATATPRPPAPRPPAPRGDVGQPMVLRPPSGKAGGQPPRGPAVDASPALPAQAELVLSALEAGRHQGQTDRRAARRRTLRVKATLRLFSDTPHTPAWTLFTRDVHNRGLGFITPHRLPLGYGGVLELPASCAGPAAEGTTICIPCTLLRCREAAPGWFEGSVYFNREQPQFATDEG